MRRTLLWVAASAWVCSGIYFGCAAGGSSDEDDGSSSSTMNGSGGSGGTTVNGPGAGSGGNPFEGCATFTAAGEVLPAAMLFVLDMSASMTTGNKYSSAQLAIATAMDKDEFDNLDLGLVTFPASYSSPPQCLCSQLGTNAPCDSTWQALTGTPGVSCGVSALPQVALANSGTDKSNAGSGVRSSIYNFLASNTPQSTQDDGSPIYEAMLAGYNALKFYNGVERRILVLITDGGFSCTSLSNPQRPSFQDANGCPDWEHPDNVNQLISENLADAEAPVNTFIVGVPGTDTNGGSSGGFDNPPYSMLLALSTYAVNGSPDTVPADCEANLNFSQSGSAPAVPCHFDLSSGQLDPGALADALAAIRGQALGCVYDLPEPPPGETIDPGLVNVETTIDGNSQAIPRRSDPSDTCADVPCWDYTDEGQVQLIGKACEDLLAADSAAVEIVVGCETLLK